MEEQIIALEAPPRTLDVQQFARARAAELLSLHTILNESKKRKASSISSHGDADDKATEGDAVDLYRNFTSLPRHLRRRTSSYIRRRRPLPWLYKKKKNAPNSSTSTILRLPSKRERQRKRRQSQLPIHRTALPPRMGGGDEVPAISSQVGVNASDFRGGDSIDGSTSRSPHGFQQDLAAPSSPSQHLKIEMERRSSLDSRQKNLVDSSIASSSQPIIEGVSLVNEDCTLCSLETPDAVDVNKIAAPAQVDTCEIQQQPDSIAMRSKDGIGIPAQFQVDCDATGKEVANGFTLMDLDGSHGYREDAIDDKEVTCSMSEDNPNSLAQASCHEAQQEALQDEEDLGAMVQVHHHQVQLKDVAVTQESRECIASLRVDHTTPLAQIHSNTAPQVDFDHTAQMELEAKHIDGIASTQRCDIEIEQRPIGTKTRKKVCRALRRLIEFKPGGPLVSSDGTRRLGTHIWHAKRFAMEKKWGFHIPLGRPGRGHGSRAVLKWARDKALLHDASFINAIQLHGKEEEIMKVLKLVLEPAQSIDCCLRAVQTSWREFTRALLHHVGPAPHKVISSVFVMWKPEVGELSSHNGGVVKIKDRDVWLWVHAAAFEEAFQALKDICCQLNGEAKEEGVKCSSRKGDLGRVDLIGQKSFEVLEEVLFPVYRDLQGKCIALHKLSELINSVEGNAVVHMEVSDPRLKQTERCLALDPNLPQKVSVFEDRSGQSLDSLERDRKSVKEGIEPAHAEFDCSLNFEHYCSNDSIDALWACETKPGCPLKEKFLSKMRHTDRLDSFGLGEETGKINRMQERRKILSGRFRCPVILLKHEHEKATGCGWSVILPLNWISAFWVPLVFAGGHVIGIRERLWLYTDAGIPSFPEDFPDSKAYTELMAANSSQDTKEAAPKFFSKKRFCRSSSQTSQSIPGKACNGLSEQCPIEPHLMPSSTDSRDGGSNCLIARTSEQLTSYLQVTDQTELLLFPAQTPIKEKFKGLDGCLHGGTVAWRARSQEEETQLSSDNVACMLRVSIRPFRKGVVKVGAMVYAPTSEEYTRWSCMEKPQQMSASEKCSQNNSERAIGCATSMAPRGSKVPAANAFCDAVALGRARGRQWVETTWHKTHEIFLMFCNQGSDTLRPAFASIYLEKGPDI